MAGVSEKSGAIEAPIGVVIHILQMPCSETLWVGKGKEALRSGIESTVDAKNGIERDFLVICCKAK